MYYFTKHKVTLHTIEGYIHKQKYKDMNCKNDHQIWNRGCFYDRKECNSKGKYSMLPLDVKCFISLALLWIHVHYNNLYMFISEIFHNKNDY